MGPIVVLFDPIVVLVGPIILLVSPTCGFASFFYRFENCLIHWF